MTSLNLFICVYSFLFACPKEQKTASPACYVFVDSAISKAFIKDDTYQELSQTSYEDQSSDDVWSPSNTKMSQNSTSLSSENSQCSIGYYSDTSYDETISTKSTLLPLPKATCKHLLGKGNKESHHSSESVRGLTSPSTYKSSKTSCTVSPQPSSTKKTSTLKPSNGRLTPSQQASSGCQYWLVVYNYS